MLRAHLAASAFALHPKSHLVAGAWDGARPLFLDAVAGFDAGVLVHAVLASLVFALLGIVVFGIAFWVITKIAPFSIRKEIEEDQNTSLGIVIGAVIIGLSLIISAAIKG